MRFWLTTFLWILVCSSPLIAQSADSDDGQIDALLASPSITWAQAAWLVGRSVGVVEEGAMPADAARLAAESGWIPQGIEAQDSVSLAGYCYLVSKAKQISGGLLFSVFPGPRYAFREFVFKKLVPGGQLPDAPLSGQEALLYLQNAERWQEARS